MASPCAPFVPPGFVVPDGLQTPEFCLRMLTIHDVVRDYDAVMTSAAHLRTVWPHGAWPDGLTLEQNLIDLGWHQKEFQNRSSFAYTVVDPAGAQVLGCVYIDPSRKRGHDAVLLLWARQSVLASGLEARLLAAVQAWLASDWPFQHLALPGRAMSWDDWNALPDAWPLAWPAAHGQAAQG
jgi:hypothetical protein